MVARRAVSASSVVAACSALCGLGRAVMARDAVAASAVANAARAVATAVAAVAVPIMACWFATEDELPEAPRRE